MWRNRLFLLLGGSILLLTALESVPIMVAFLTSDAAALGALMTSFTLSTLVGGALYFGFYGAEAVRTPALTVLLPITVLVGLAATAGLPFFFLNPQEGAIPAFFEGMSFLTTSGASAYPGETIPPALDLWRALVAWAGGFIAILYGLSILTALNSGGQQLHASPLPYGDSQSGYSRFYSMARGLSPLYGFVTASFAVLFMLGGVPILPAIQMAMGGVSTTAIEGYGVWLSVSPVVELAFLLLMIVGLGNWDMMQAFFEGKKRSPLRDPEARMITTLLFVAALALAVASLQAGGSLWSYIFHMISALSGTGAQLSGSDALPSDLGAIGIVFMVLVAVGGASMSSTGGLKNLRLQALVILVRSELERLAHPHGVRILKLGRAPLTARDRDAVYLLLGGFTLSLLFGSLMLGVQGVSFEDSIALALASLALAGPTVEFFMSDTLGYTALTNSDYLILTVLMLIGRLEATVFLAIFTKSLWRR